MIETTTRWLTFKEELALAVFFSNVEKFKCLTDMPNYKVELLTEPMRIWNKNDAPLATINACGIYFRERLTKKITKAQIRRDMKITVWKRK